MPRFDATSNVLAGMHYGIPVKGTHAHAYIQSFASFDDLGSCQSIRCTDGSQVVSSAVFCERALSLRAKIFASATDRAKCVDGELFAFVSYALAFPADFLALVDTYDTIDSGVTNFMCVALALRELGYQAVGIRLDSGNLAELSLAARKRMRVLAYQYSEHIGDGRGAAAKDMCSRLLIMASNDLNEAKLHELRTSPHEINAFGIGTELVTCRAQPALGGVFKLTQLDGVPRIKISEDPGKTTIPGAKNAYRLFANGRECRTASVNSENSIIVLDVLTLVNEPAPVPGESFEYVRVAAMRRTGAGFDTHTILAAKVEVLLSKVYGGEVVASHERHVEYRSVEKAKQRALEDVQSMLSVSSEQTSGDLRPQGHEVVVSKKLAVVFSGLCGSPCGKT